CRTEDDLIRECADARIVVYFGNDLPFTERVLDRMTECLLIQRVAIGFDSVDVEAATERGIIVSNSAGYCTEEVAVQALAMLLACNQQIPWHQQNLRKGKWYVVPDPPTERLSEQTLGIVGLGRIGGMLCRRAKHLVARVLAYDPYLTSEQFAEIGAEQVDFETILAESDLLSLNCPLTAETRGLIDAEALSKMKPTAVLVNTARGPVVEIDALYDALANRRLRGAGLDVYPIEPPPLPLHSLFSLPNVITTPQSAAGSRSSLVDLWRVASEGVTSVLKGQLPETIVNPEVESRLLAGVGKVRKV
ncbi:MAG TPA: C-terminal binding protein, partial [Planctomycetaceae bacterium]|nr:C-terminal binding protein [Planctomycetaceae bacterium]